MAISFDPPKRDLTLRERGLDFADAAEVFAIRHFDAVDDRKDYGEIRVTTFGKFKGRMVVIVWTRRGDARHVFSMRKANDREQKRYGIHLD